MRQLSEQLFDLASDSLDDPLRIIGAGVAQLEAELARWEEEIRRYAEYADFWRERAEALQRDQLDWRKGVGLIDASLFERKTNSLSCVAISEAVMRLKADYDVLLERAGRR